MEAPSAAPSRRNRLWKRLATLAAVCALLAVALISLPRGFDTDLGRIGSGKPALVFVYDPNLVVSNQQTREMDKARERLGQDLHFLIADVGRPDAQRFLQQHDAKATQLLLFAADGRALGRLQSLVTEEVLVSAIEAAGVARSTPPGED